MSFLEILVSNSDLQARQERTKKIVSNLQADFDILLKDEEQSLSIFSAGSIGRNEVGINSDIDAFVLCDKKISEIDERRIKDIVNKVANKNGFENITEDYFKIYYVDDLLKLTGKSEDDHVNTFTTRILMLLESTPIYNKKAYDKYRHKIVLNYFRDSEGRKSEFRPVFLLNDFLRYWRTLCLNYEKIRNNPETPWRKKNINLKFARRFTVFSTLIPLIVKPVRSVEGFVAICEKTPMERLAYGLTLLEDQNLIERYKQVIDYYVTFLLIKEEDEVEDLLDIVKPIVHEMDIYSRQFLFDVLMHKRIVDEYKHFLVL